MSTTPLRILVVEDDPLQVLSLRLLLPTLGYEVAGVAATAAEAVKRFRDGRPDLVLLDVTLAGPRDGIDLAHELVALRPVPLIFLTAYPDQTTFERARAVGPFAFLGKPYNGLLLGHSIALAVQHFGARLPASAGPPPPAPADGVTAGGVFVREAGRLLKVPFAALLVAEADGSYTHLLTAGRKYTLRSSLRTLEQELPGEQFLRVHRRYLVQVSQVSAFDPLTVSIGPHRLPLGRAYREGLRARLPHLR